MTKINYIKGDATQPQTSGWKLICHICNDLGRWGKGFVLEVSKRWPVVEQSYRDWHKHKADKDFPFALGKIQSVSVGNYTIVVNMVAQRGIKTNGRETPIRYDALEQCLEKVVEEVYATPRLPNCSIHMPRIGCGLAGGKWSKVEPIIQRTLCKNNIPVTVYDYCPARTRT